MNFRNTPPTLARPSGADRYCEISLGYFAGHRDASSSPVLRGSPKVSESITAAVVGEEKKIFLARFVFRTRDIQDLSFFLERTSHTFPVKNKREDREGKTDRRKVAKKKEREKMRGIKLVNRSLRCETI